MQETVYDAAVIGGGIAGYEAVLTLKNFKRSVLWLGVKKFGEKLENAEWVRNFPSFSGTGAEFAALLTAQVEREGIALTEARIDGVYAMGEKFLLTAGKQTFAARTVVLATGVETAGSMKGEREFFGRGVSYCAVCDGALYKGKTIAAVCTAPQFEEEVEYLAGFAEKVYAFCTYQGAHFKATNIEVFTETPQALEGGMRVEKIVVKGGEYAVDGVFFLKRSTPPAALVGGLETTEDGHAKISRDGSTNIKGLFAAGDITGRPYQFAKAAGEGCVAAYSVHAYLNKLPHSQK